MSGYATVADAQRALDVNTGRIEGTSTHLEHLYDERRTIFRYLLDNGERQAAIARRAHVTAMAVALAVGKAKPSRRKAAAGSTSQP